MNPQSRSPLGATGVEVTCISIGTAPVGGLFAPVSDAEAETALTAAWDAGLRFFDAAPLYGHGRAEERLGAFLQDRDRDDVVIATKVGRLLVEHPDDGDDVDLAAVDLYPGAPQVTPVFDYSYEGTLRSLTASLERLGLDRVDVVHIHDPDRHHDAALAGAYRALADLRRQGVIRAVGAGMNQTAMLARFAREADFDVFLLAGRYTLLEQQALDELLPACVEHGVAVIAAGVLNTGILVDPSPGARYDYATAPPDVLARANAIQAVCTRHGVPLAAAALQFPLAHPAVATVLVGTRSAAEVRQNVDRATLPIPDDLWAELREEGLLRNDAPVPHALDSA